MPSNKITLRLSQFLHSMPLERVGYPLGVVVVFCAIFFSAFFSYRFFFRMIERVTTLTLFATEEGVTFHLDEYRAIASSFTALVPSPTPTTSTVKSAVVLRSTPSRKDRVASAQTLLEQRGWSVTIVDGEIVQGEQLTTIVAKETQEKEAQDIAALLAQQGLIAVVEKSIAKDEKFDILITLGAY